MCLGGKKYLPGLIFMLLVLCFYGCGKGDDGSGERLSGPIADSALPMRVDVTITPPITKTPQAIETPQVEKNAQNQPKASELEARLTILMPTLDITPEVATPDPTGSTKSYQKEVLSEPSPTPLPMPTPTPEIESSASEDSLSESVNKNAVVLQEEPSSPQSTLQSQQKESEVEEESEVKEEKQPSPSQKDPTQQPRITQSVSIKEEKIEKPAKSPTPTVTSYDGVTLDEITVCTKISNRNPSGAADTFSLSKVKKVYTWMRVSGAKPPMVLKHMYYWEGKLVATIKLKIKYSSMRTWSQKTFKSLESLGKWKVLVTTENEDEIFAVTEFTVVP